MSAETIYQARLMLIQAMIHNAQSEQIESIKRLIKLGMHGK